MTHYLIVIVLGFPLVAGSSLFAAPRIGTVTRCADGTCVPKRNTFGYHAGGWRQWPGGKSSEKGVRPGTAKRAPLKDLPVVELPDPRHEDTSERQLLPPRSDQSNNTGPTVEPKQSDPPPLPPIDPEDAPPGLPKTMQDLDAKPKPPTSPLNELFRNTPLPEPQPGQGANSAPGPSSAGMPLTIFRPSAEVRTGKPKASNLSTLLEVRKHLAKKNEALPGRYMSGVFMGSDKLAKVSKAKKSDSDSRWINPLRAGSGSAADTKEPSGFVAKVFAPPRRNDRTAAQIEKLVGSRSRAIEDPRSQPELASATSQELQKETQGEVSKSEPVRSVAISEGLPNQNPLRESVRTDQYVKPVSYEVPSLPKAKRISAQRSNPLRSGR